MKKVEVEKLISKMLIITAVIGCIMIGTYLIQRGYFSYSTVLVMPELMFGFSIIFVINAIACVLLGTTKNKIKFSELSLICKMGMSALVIAVLALALLIFKIHIVIVLGTLLSLVITRFAFRVTDSTKYYSSATWLAALAVFFMLLKINYEIKALQVAIGSSVIKFYPASLTLLVVGLAMGWIYTIVKVVRD